MPNHKNLTYTKLHKAVFNSGDAVDLPDDPDGKGDVYWSPDEEKLYIADGLGTSWIDYDLSGGGGGVVSSLDDVGDVDASAPSADQILYWNNGDGEWQAKTLPNFTTHFKLSQLTDVSGTALKGSVLVHNGSGWVALGVGVNGTVIQADSAQTVGLHWTVLDLATVDASYINVTNRTTNPSSSPASGKAWMFVKNDEIYVKNSAGTLFGPMLTTASNGALDDLTDVDVASAAKGSVMVYDGTEWIDVGVGSNDQVLTADSTTGSGTAWKTIASSPADLELMTLLGML